MAYVPFPKTYDEHQFPFRPQGIASSGLVSQTYQQDYVSFTYTDDDIAQVFGARTGKHGTLNATRDPTRLAYLCLYGMPKPNYDAHGQIFTHTNIDLLKKQSLVSTADGEQRRRCGTSPISHLNWFGKLTSSPP